MGYTNTFKGVVQDAPQPDMKVEMQRRKSHYQQILALFKERGELTNLEMAKITFRYSARLGDMRKEHRIVAQYEKPGVWRYIYLGERDSEE